jgi:2,5-dioxopentanoate dehydrogenase
MKHITLSQITSQAVDALWYYRTVNRKKRYDFLQAIAKNLLLEKEAIINQSHSETHLAITDLTAEFERTIFQIQSYSHTLLKNTYQSSDTYISLGKEAIGCVVVFGASNFPLAYSTAGGDVISALVAGCSVIFKAHDAHLKTSRLVNHTIQKAILECDMPEHLYQHLENLSYDDAALLVTQPEIKAVGFTGSLTVGRYLFDICQARPEPIPFFGELGSINPVFVCKSYFAENYKMIANDYTQSFSGRGGQVCTHPALLVIPHTDITQEFYTLLLENFAKITPQKMLTETIFERFKQGYNYLKKHYQQIGNNNPIHNHNTITPVLFSVSPEQWLHDKKLPDEIFGTIGIVIQYTNHTILHNIAHSFLGQLTASIHSNEKDREDILFLEKILVQKVGRLIYNEYPTGVNVAYNMHHSGVYPASTCSQFTAVGERAISRFLRPVCYQNQPNFSFNYKNSHDFYPSETNTIQAQELANFVAKKLNDAVLKNGHAYLAVSGGQSPIAFFNALSHKNLKWDNITVSLVDERCVDGYSSESNEKLVRDNLLINKAHTAHFIGLYNNELHDYSLNNLNTNTSIPKKFDCIILGMGEDGHFASLFKNSENFYQGINGTEKYSLQFTPNTPTHRISMNLPFIIHSNTVCLAIAGTKKLALLNEALEDGESIYPIAYLLQKAKINIFYVE